jgi:hypothetical protein
MIAMSENQRIDNPNKTFTAISPYSVTIPTPIATWTSKFSYFIQRKGIGETKVHTIEQRIDDEHTHQQHRG